MELLGEKREITGSKVKKLREIGLIPAIIFSKKASRGIVPTTPITVVFKEFIKIYKEAGESTLIDLKIKGDQERKVLISEVQKHPVTLDPIHVSFYKVDLTEKITANIPITLINEEECRPVKTKEGSLLQVLNEVEIECLPSDLPSVFEVDVSVMQNVGDALTVKDCIKVDPAKVDLKEGLEEIVVKVDFAEQLVVEEEEPVSVDQVEVITEAEVKEGEEGLEGAVGSESKDEKPGETKKDE
jgi:large subunit ribosomal protein L25